ncbi:MAG: NAD(P)/FAD-dependent oxidoreductase [Microthrixaceae bacterium]
MNPTSSLDDARPAVLWTDVDDAPPVPEPPSPGASADLVVVGSGYTGLWAALRAKVEHPSLDVMILDRAGIAAQASTRNGGFLSASLTHGLPNGLDRFPRQVERILDAGRRNFAGLVEDLTTHGIDAHLELTGQITAATRPWQMEELLVVAELHRLHGDPVQILDRDQLRSEVDSPTYQGGIAQMGGEALVDPARLAWGLAAAVQASGVRLHGGTTLTGIERRGAGLELQTDQGPVRCGAAILGTGAFRSPVTSLNRRVVPVYDHVLATEPLTSEQRASIGWSHRQGVSDAANQFHYYRLSADDRIVWGGYDAVFHNWGRIDASFEQRDATHAKLAEHFFETFPQLEGLRFTHRWGGVIDTSTRFSVGFGTAFDGRVAFAVGYTGLGVGASRFGGQVCVDLLYRPESELLELDLVRRRALPFPPEPLRTAGIQLTRRAIASADAADGRRGPWLRALDRLGLGFDS